jgi:hypothetical protein
VKTFYKTILGGVFAGAIVLGGASATFAYPNTGGDNVVINNGGGPVIPGGTFVVTAGGFDPFSGVDVFINIPGSDNAAPVLLGTLTADADGAISGSFTLDSDLAAGDYEVQVSGVDPDGNPRVLTSTVTVTAATDDPSSESGSGTTADGGDSLSEAGANILPMLLVAGGAGAAGTAVLRISRRRA